jgi:hypothetical protein
VACHTEEHNEMLNDWKQTMEDEVAGAEEVEAEARALLTEVKDRLNEEQLRQAESMLTKGVELLDIVRVGNGVHNKKYAITILDGAFGNFEDTIELLEEPGATE